MTVKNGSLTIGSDFVKVTDAIGTLRIDSSGVAGSINATPNFDNLPGIKLPIDKVSLKVNTSSREVSIGDAGDLLKPGPY